MAHYLSQPRIEDPIWLEPNDISFLQTRISFLRTHVSFLQTRISEAETVAQRIENQIQELRAQIAELTREKDTKLAEITSLRNVLAPVRRAPLEILSEIFELSCLDDEDDCNDDLVRTMFTLSGVCAAWRKAAHATPRLWRRLNVSSEKIHLGSDFGWVDGWITRCQGLPLDLYLDLYVDQSGDLKDVERGEEFLEYVLANFSHKIRTLDVWGQPSSFLPILQLPPPSSLVSLERVCLCPFSDSEDSMERIVECYPSKVEVFLGSPKLREVELEDISFLKLLVLPAEQLTSLKLEPAFELALCWDLLSRCKNLVSLEIDGLSSSVNNHPIISLPALKSFQITDSYCVSTRNFLRRLTAPLLRELFIEYGIEDNFERHHSEDLDGLIDDLTAFQQRSATRLSSLSLTLSHRLHEPLIEKTAILSLFPTIQLFEFRTPFDVNPLIRAMTCTEGYHVLPNLQHLKLYCSGPKKYIKYLDTSELKSMVLSRWWPERLGVGSGLVSNRNGLCCLQKVTVCNFHVQGLVEDITDLSALSGFILDYTPTKRGY